MVIYWNWRGFSGDLLGFIGDLMELKRFSGDLMGFNGDLMELKVV